MRKVIIEVVINGRVTRMSRLFESDHDTRMFQEMFDGLIKFLGESIGVSNET